jgi:hypothetical protein
MIYMGLYRSGFGRASPTIILLHAGHADRKLTLHQSINQFSDGDMVTYSVYFNNQRIDCCNRTSADAVIELIQKLLPHEAISLTQPSNNTEKENG